MPQFPHQTPNQSALSNQSGVEPAVTGEQDAELELRKTNAEPASKPKSKKPPVKFKSVESKGPVKRVRISGDERRAKKSSHQAPFKDAGVLDDLDSLVNFKNEFGVPVVLTIAALAVVALLYLYTRGGDDSNNSEIVQQLLARSVELEDQRPTNQSELPKFLNRQYELANELLEVGTDSDVIDKGAELKLRSLTQLDSINLLRDSVDPEIQEQLETTSRKFINSQNSDVCDQAKVGLTLIRTHRYLEQPDIRFFPELLDQFKLVAQKIAKDDFDAAQSLMRIADSFADRNYENESSQLYRAIGSSFPASHNDDIAEIGAAARSKIASPDNLLVELKALVPTDETPDLAKIRKLVVDNTKAEAVSTSRIEGILDFVDFLIDRNLISVGKEILGDLSNAVNFIPAGIERDAIKRRFSNQQKQLDLVGQEFGFDGLFSVAGRPITRTSLKQQLKMIVFWSPENQESIEILNKISAQHRDFEQAKIQVVAIASVSDSDDERSAIESMSNNSRGIEFLTLIKSDLESQKFVGRFPIPKLPFWVLLNQENKIMGYNLSPKFIDLK